MRYIIIVLILIFIGCKNLDNNKKISYSNIRFIEHIESNINGNSCLKIKFQNNSKLDSFFISKYPNGWEILAKKKGYIVKEPFLSFNLSVGDTIYSSGLFDRILLDKKIIHILFLRNITNKFFKMYMESLFHVSITVRFML